MPDQRFVAVLKRACETSVMVAPVLAELANEHRLDVWSQDDPAFPPEVEVHDDRSLQRSPSSWPCPIEDPAPRAVRTTSAPSTTWASPG